MTESRKGGVVLAGGDHRSTLAVARSLARRGIHLTLIGVQEGSAVAASRHVRDYMLGPNPRLEPDAFAALLCEVVRTRGARLVIPANDSTLAACDLHRASIEEHAKLACPGSSAIWNALDKSRNLALARKVGIPCPAQVEIESIDQLPEVVEHLGFPLVLKNPGRFTDAGRLIPLDWLVARDEGELRALLAEHCGQGPFPLFQELATGAVHNVCCFAVGGELVAAHEYLSIRRFAGQGVLREVIPASPELTTYAERMLRELSWEGVAHLGFFVRPTDGAVRYMETNGRFWGSLEGSIRAGWDFPVWTFDYFAKGIRPVPQRLQVGSRTCWHLGDLRALVGYFRDGVLPTSVEKSRGRAVLDYISGFTPGVGADMFSADDPLPELVEHWNWLRQAISARRRRTGAVEAHT